MGRDGIRTTLGFALVAVAALGTGCPNSDPLVTQPGNVVLELTNEPPGAGRYEASTFRINKITFRPVDPQAAATLGGASMSFFTSPVSNTFLNPTLITVASIPLSDGTYQIESVVFSNPDLTDFDPVTPPTSCLEQVLAEPRTAGKLPPPEVAGLVLAQSAVTVVTGFTPPPTFTVTRGGLTTIHMSIDGPGFVQAFENGFSQNCRTVGTCQPGGSQTYSAPCISAFTALTSAQLRPLLHFE